MNATNKLLDKYRRTCYPANDNAIARQLGVSRAAVSRWTNGHGHPDVDSVEKMADAIKEPMAVWVTAIEAERARTPAAKRAWLRLAATIGTAASIAIASAPLAQLIARSLSIV